MSDEVLRDSLEKARQELERLLSEARLKFEDIGCEFVNQGIGILVGGLKIYGDLFKRSGYEDRQSLEQAVSKHNKAVKEAAQELLDVEADWSEFLRSIEAKELNEEEHVLPDVGDKISMDITFNSVFSNETQHVSSGSVTLGNLLSSQKQSKTLLVLNRHFACLPCRIHVSQLAERQDELSAAGCQVVVVTFGHMSGAERWLLETKCPFPYYTNPARDLYKALGLRRSIESVWNATTLSFYGGKLAKNEPLPKAYADIKDDPHQMGGDFILDEHSNLMFAYRSKLPSDRPSVDLILDALASMKCKL